METGTGMDTDTDMETGEWGRPRVVLSRCLEMAACRYDGGGIRSAVVRLLADHVEYVPVCPEVRIGLGVPRAPIRIEEEGGVQRLVQPSTGRDLTERMTRFGESFAADTAEVDGVLLKSRSPSCGIGDVKIFAGGEPRTDGGTGMFARVLRERFAAVPMQDEARLTDPVALHDWLTRVWASARLRRAGLAGGAGLTELHALYRPLLAQAAGELLRRLDRLMEEVVEEASSSRERRDGFEELEARYRTTFMAAIEYVIDDPRLYPQALRTPPGPTPPSAP